MIGFAINALLLGIVVLIILMVLAPLIAIPLAIVGCILIVKLGIFGIAIFMAADIYCLVYVLNKLNGPRNKRI